MKERYNNVINYMSVCARKLGKILSQDFFLSTSSRNCNFLIQRFNEVYMQTRIEMGGGVGENEEGNGLIVSLFFPPPIPQSNI